LIVDGDVRGDLGARVPAEGFSSAAIEIDEMTGGEWLAYLQERAPRMELPELEPFVSAWISRNNLDPEVFRAWALEQRKTPPE
jgi:hypothetical protein